MIYNKDTVKEGGNMKKTLVNETYYNNELVNFYADYDILEQAHSKYLDGSLEDDREYTSYIVNEMSNRYHDEFDIAKVNG